MGFGIIKEASSNTTPSEIVNFDKLTPTTAGVVFDPNTPATLDVLYVSSVDASTWIWNGTAYVTYTAPATATTEWYLLGTTIDAGSNKTAPISRNNSIYTIGYDSYFNNVRVGRGNNNIATNTVVGSGAGGAISTGSGNSFFGANSGRVNSIGNFNSFFGTYAGYSNTFADSNTFIGNSAGYNFTTGGGNVSIGYLAGKFYGNLNLPLTTGSNSVYIGNQATALVNGSGNEIVIGSQAMGKGANTVNIGNTSITNTYLNGAVTFNNAFTFPTTDGTANQVLKTNGSGTVTWGTAGSSSGIWGIANSSGVYTYYATWALAVAAATSGQCIELFADITESSVSYTLKNGVNINGNGHTISFSVNDGFIATSAPTICEINNIVVNQATSSVAGLYINATGSIIGGNATFNSNNASSYGVYGRLVTRIYGFNCNGYTPIFTSNTVSPNAVIDNVYVDSLGGGITTGTLSNSIIKSNTASGVPVGLCYTINNCYIYSNGGSAIGATIAIEVNNSTIISVTSRVLTGSPGIFTLNNCYIKSSAGDVGNGTFNNCVILSSINPINAYMGNGTFNNCTITASASAVFSLLGSGSVNNCNVICNYNNAGGYGFYYSTCSVNNSIIQLANSSSTAFYSAGAVTMYLANNSIKGTTNFKNANVTNGQTNTADAQGNVFLQ